MTATDELRRMLDERGVEWWQSANTLGCIFTRWYSPIFGDEVVAMENGKEGLVLFDHFMTPEQAIAATLGSCNCSNSERTNEPCLPHFWTHDGTLHIEATRMPTRIVVCEGGTCEFVPKRELDASEAENAKLRELVTQMHTCLTRPKVYTGKSQPYLIATECPYFTKGKCDYNSCGFEQRMRELGAEVDE